MDPLEFLPRRPASEQEYELQRNLRLLTKRVIAGPQLGVYLRFNIDPVQCMYADIVIDDIFPIPPYKENILSAECRHRSGNVLVPCTVVYNTDGIILPNAHNPIGPVREGFFTNKGQLGIDELAQELSGVDPRRLRP